jgi:3-phenylpropionate/trans-cinnamate dioxygenase ferredoxin reductase component
VPDRIVIVGASLAGLRAAETLRQHGHDGSITIVGNEFHRPYDRPPLSKQVLTGKIEPEATALAAPDELAIEWVLGRTATGVDLDHNRLNLDGGEDVGYDRLLIATGAAPRMLPGAPPGPGVHYLRTLDDAVALRADLRKSRALAVIGAGFIGLEVAGSAQQLGIPTAVLEALPVPLERALGLTVGQAVAAWHRAKGTNLLAGVSVTAIERDRDGRPEAVRLGDGTAVPADTVVVGIGVAPSTDWLAGSGIDLSDGVLCDSRLRVRAGGRPVDTVLAAGDVARWDHPGHPAPIRVEHWTNATEAGEAAAMTMLQGDGAEPYGPTPYFWSDQHGVKLQMVGRVEPDADTTVLEGSFEEDRVLIAYGSQGRLVAALGIRRPARVMAMARQIADRAPYPPPA